MDVKYKCDFLAHPVGVHVAQRTDLQVDVPIDQGSSPVVQVGVPDCGAGGGNCLHNRCAGRGSRLRSRLPLCR